MNYINDQRIVMTLDAGGTNFVFSAMQGGREIVTPVHISTCSADLEVCLSQLIEGFTKVKEQLNESAVAISFAFPGPADYTNGIIGDLPNFPCFRGGVALGPMLNEVFGLPVFINNDGDLFAFGEALTGVLPEINHRLTQAGSKKSYKNLIGVTFGTGFGCGVVINNQLLMGDNASGGDIWCFRNKKYPQLIIEESVSIRAIKRVYKELSGDSSELTPKDIYEIAEGTRAGNVEAARASFAELGEMAGDALASAVTLVDGIIAIGGGLSGASKYIVPRLIEELNGQLGMMSGASFPRLQVKAYNLDDESVWDEFAKGQSTTISIPHTSKTLNYDPMKRIGVMTSHQGASRSIALGAYVYALSQL